MTDEIVQHFPFEFYDRVFELYVTDDLQPYLPIRPLCDSLGIDPSAQLRRIKADEILLDGLRVFNLHGGSSWGGARQASCLALRRLPYWLGTISTRRIKPEQRDKVIAFKREFADSAWDAFRSAVFPADILAEMDAAQTPQAQEYHRLMDEAARLRQMIREQKSTLDEVVTRVAGLEARFLGTDFINSSQASQIRRMSALLAGKIEPNKTKQNRAFASIYGELKRKFDVPSYLLIAERDFPKVVEFLAAWYQRVAHDKPPQVFRVNQQTLF